MAQRHPGLQGDKPLLVMGEVELIPILTKTKPFVTMNESTVCTVETKDTAGAKRGAIAVGFSRHDIPHGFVTYSSIEEAEALLALIRNAIDDAQRIEAGQTPIAAEGIAPPVKH